VKDLGTSLEVSVTDSGKGIPKAIRDKLMQPFFTTKGIGKGTGLGLSISRGIVHSHNGVLEVDTSCPNTRFVVRLPKRQWTKDEEPAA
jgi:signal transduction histidine kinase